MVGEMWSTGGLGAGSSDGAVRNHGKLVLRRIHTEMERGQESREEDEEDEEEEGQEGGMGEG